MADKRQYSAMRPRPPAPAPEHRVAVLAYDGLCTFEFAIAVEVFGLARPELGDHWYRSFRVCAVDRGALRATGGVRIAVDGGLPALARADTIVIPGWRDPDERPPEVLLAALRRAHGRGARLLSICSGVYVLAASGLLDGRRATTHWRYLDHLRATHPGIALEPDVLYVDEGQLLTSAGSAAGIDLCLHLVRRDFGVATANAVARRLVMPAHREGDQAQYLHRPLPARERHSLAPLLDRVRSRLHEDWPVPRMADEAHLSPRHFARRFQETTGTSPGEWLLTERLGAARDLLEAGDTAIELVAERCGFGSAATLRHHFRTRLGVSPNDYRRRFGSG